MAYTTKYSFGLIAALLLSAGAIAQTETQNQSMRFMQPEARLNKDVVGSSDGMAQGTPPRTSLSTVLADTLFKETFTGGLGGWTTTNAKTDRPLIWIYRDPATSPKKDTISGAYQNISFVSPTSGTGFALINFDSLDSKDGANGGVDGPSVDQSLVSPVLDLKNNTNQLSIQYYQFYRWCCDANSAYISFSNDGGETFADEILVAPALGANNYFGAITRNAAGTAIGVGAQNFVPIPKKYNASSTFAFRFRYSGDYYAWAVDDIVITALPNNETSLNSDFIAVAPNFRTPQSQVAGQNIYFVTDVQNNGGLDQTPTVRVTIQRLLSGGERELYYTDSLKYPNIVAGGTFDNNVFEKSTPMPTQAGQYRVTYDVITRDASDADFLPANNTATYDFVVGAADSLARYYKAATLRSSTTPGETAGPGDFELGNIYYTPNLGTKGMRLDSIILGYNLRGYNDNGDNAFFEVRTYGYKGDLDKDGIPKIGTDAPEATDELVLLGTRFFTITPTSALGFQTIKIVPGEIEIAGQAPQPSRILLPAGQGYIGYAVGVSYTEGSSKGTIEDNMFIGVDTRFDIAASRLVRDSLARRGISPLTEEYNSYGDFRGVTPRNPVFDVFGGTGFFINTIVTFLDSVNLTSVKTELVAKEFTLAPNPASTEVNISFDFGDNISGVTFKVFNGVGQQVMYLNEPIAPTGRITIPVASLNQGVYFVTATAQNGSSTTRRVLIQR